jgi:hypothetical protein
LIANNTAKWLFVVDAFSLQALLLVNFAARTWGPALERRYGPFIYTLGIAGVALGIPFALAGEPWHIVAAPLAYALWSAFGYCVDIYRVIPWRSPPLGPVFFTYVALFITYQFLFWIPLWYVGMTYWGAYTALYFLNTGLNIYSHRRWRH